MNEREKACEVANHTARLSMLALSPEEEERMGSELRSMVSFADELSALGREAPKPPQEQSEPPRLRPDAPGESLPIDLALMNAATVDGRLITVPKTF